MVDRVPMRDEVRTLSPKPVGEPVTRPDEAIPVVAWLATRDGDIQVTGWAIAWSPRAVHLRYHDRHGREGFAWVWANAVTRR